MIFNNSISYKMQSPPYNISWIYWYPWYYLRTQGKHLHIFIVSIDFRADRIWICGFGKVIYICSMCMYLLVLATPAPDLILIITISLSSFTFLLLSFFILPQKWNHFPILSQKSMGFLKQTYQVKCMWGPNLSSCLEYKYWNQKAIMRIQSVSLDISQSISFFDIKPSFCIYQIIIMWSFTALTNQNGKSFI